MKRVTITMKSGRKSSFKATGKVVTDCNFSSFETTAGNYNDFSLSEIEMVEWYEAKEEAE